MAAAVAACTGSEADRPRGPQVTRDTVGDTIIVRTLTGSAWGTPGRLVEDLSIGVLEGPDHYVFGRIHSLAVGPDGSIYVFDAQATELRKYARDGTFLTVVGREGGGPGEYRQPDGGLAVTADGRVLLRDPGNGRISVYSTDGEYLDAWRVRGSFSSSRRLYVDTAGNAYSAIRLDPTADILDWRYGLVRYRPDGTSADTLAAPVYEEPPPLTARNETAGSRRTSSRPAPLAPFAVWTFSPLGYFVGGIATDYAIDLYRPESVLRIEREYDPVEVQAEEREDMERRATDLMRQTDPNWRWNGPPIPETKPPYRAFFIGQQGRIWVQLYQPARAEEVDDADTADPASAPRRRWIEPPVFDVFEPDGSYLGIVRGPEGLSIFPTPTARGDTLWAVVRGELDVPYIKRFHIELGAESER